MIYQPNVLRRCSGCGDWKLATPEFFYRHKGFKDNLSYQCKECDRAYNRDVYARNQDIMSARVRNRYAKDPEAARDRARRYLSEHRPVINAQRRERYAKNRDAILEQSRRYREDKRPTVRAWRRDYYRRHREEIRQNRRPNPDVRRASHYRRRARKRNLPAAFTAADWRRALDYFGGCCAVCGRPPGLWHTIAADHWIPLASPDCPGTIPTNIVPLCHAKPNGEGCCNESKKDKPADQWLAERYSPDQARDTLARVQAYFDWIQAQDGHDTNPRHR